MPKFKSKFGVHEFVYFKMKGGIARTKQVRAVIFDGDQPGYYCRDSDGPLVLLMEDEIMSRSELDEIARGRHIDAELDD